MTNQRLRFRYTIESQACALTQRELVEAWRTACSRAGLILASPEGRRQSSQLAIAAPLPQGVTSSCELIDLLLEDVGPPEQALVRLAAQLPPGITLLSVDEVGLTGPSIQSQVRWAEYEACVDGLEPEPLLQALSEMLDATTLPSEYRREKKVREYDLRPLILGLHLKRPPHGCSAIVMRLRAEPERNARADQVAAALGLPPGVEIRRTRLALEEISPVLAAYRKASQPEEV
jgi:radical SAM-linked protein